MTLEEKKELEDKLFNEILNNTPLAAVYKTMAEQASAHAKKIISERTEEQLAEIKANFDKAEAEARDND